MSEETKSNEEQSKKSINNIAQKVSGGSKKGGIIIAVCMIVLGILFFVWPLIMALGIEFIAAIGIIIYGVYQIVHYAKMPADARNSWSLANGIIFIILGILAASTGVIARAEMFAFLLGFLALMSGINQISAFGAYKKSGAAGAGGLIVSGIINIILAIFFILTPFAATWVFQWVFGIYLLVGGIAFLAEVTAGQAGRKA